MFPLMAGNAQDELSLFAASAEGMVALFVLATLNLLLTHRILESLQRFYLVSSAW